MQHEHENREYGRDDECVVGGFFLAYLGYFTRLTPIIQGLFDFWRFLLLIIYVLSPHATSFSTAIKVLG